MTLTASAGNKVYVIGDPRSSGPCKIGTAINPRIRLGQIKAGDAVAPLSVNRAALEILYEYPCARAVERDLHRFYQSIRTVGEWFDVPPSDARKLIYIYLDHLGIVEQVIKRGTSCRCVVCTFEYLPDDEPGDRPELNEPYDWRLLSTVHAMTHARLGVNEYDYHVSLPASHCDIDRAVRLCESIDS